MGKELASFADEFASATTKVEFTIEATDGDSYLELFRHDGSATGIKFYTVPGGHEFNSFILALYNVAGLGKDIAPEEVARIGNIKEKTDIKVLISLSCTMCPEVVVASGKIASLNENVTASAIDIFHFPEIKEKYNIMSVPCMVINDSVVQFGKKNISQILDVLEQK